MTFWEAIEEHIAQLDSSGESEGDGAGGNDTDADADATTPADPWAGADVGDAGLTEDQVAFLAGLADQPPVPRLEGDRMPGEPTGSSPGDT